MGLYHFPPPKLPYETYKKLWTPKWLNLKKLWVHDAELASKAYENNWTRCVSMWGSSSVWFTNDCCIGTLPFLKLLSSSCETLIWTLLTTIHYLFFSVHVNQVCGPFVDCCDGMLRDETVYPKYHVHATILHFLLVHVWELWTLYGRQTVPIQSQQHTVERNQDISTWTLILPRWQMQMN